MDDLVDAKDANNVPLLLDRFEWVVKSVFSRFDNSNTGAFINIAQRLHTEDPSGAFSNLPGFVKLKISAISQQLELYPAANPDVGTWEFHEGDALQSSLANLKTLATLRQAMGEAAFFAQYLQEPIPDGGGLFSFSSFTRLPKQPRGLVHLSVDTGQTKGGGDYSVIMAIGYENERYHILDIYRDQIDFQGLRIAVRNKIAQHKPMGVLIETSGGYGEALLVNLQKEYGMKNLHPYKPHMPKQERFNKIWPVIQGGDVTLPDSAPWIETLRKELISFPAGKNDDQLDALSQFLIAAPKLIKMAGYEPPEKYSTNLLKVKMYGFG